MRDLFEQAKEAAPAIIFIDELDAVGRSRTSGAGGFSGGNDEREQTLNQILTEMDGFDTVHRRDRDRGDQPARTCSTRRCCGRAASTAAWPCSRPTGTGARKILEVHARSVPLADDVDLGRIAAATPGMVGADLANLVNEAALLAARREARAASQRADFTDALERIVLGAERKVMMSDEDRRRTAYHEGGHAIVGMLTPGADPVRKISIIPRGLALGVTFSAPDADRYNYEREELLAKIKVALGGRAAEEIVFGDLTTGAESDIQQLTADRPLHGRPLGDERGGRARGGDPTRRRGPLLPGAAEVSTRTQELIDEEVRRIASEAHERGAQAAAREPRQARRARRRAARARDAGRGRGLRGRRDRPRECNTAKEREIAAAARARV